MKPFDFTAEIRATCRDMAARLDELAHIDVGRMAVIYSRTRNESQYGIYASLTPLRFEDGATTGVRRGRRYGIQRVVDPSGVEMLYVLTVYLPRFMQLPYREKLITILHELWHVSPKFDGDLRRHPGRCYAHTTSQKEFDEAMGVLADRWLTLDPPLERHHFLQGDWNDLCRRHGKVVGAKMRRPRLLPLPDHSTAPAASSQAQGPRRPG